MNSNLWWYPSKWQSSKHNDLWLSQPDKGGRQRQLAKDFKAQALLLVGDVTLNCVRGKDGYYFFEATFKLLHLNPFGLTVWKFRTFSVIQILREINFQHTDFDFKKLHHFLKFKFSTFQDLHLVSKNVGHQTC